MIIRTPFSRVVQFKTCHGTSGTTADATRQQDSVIKINYPGVGNNSAFVIDGVGKNICIYERTNGSLTGTKQFIWAKRNLAECRDASSVLISQYFENGQTISGVNYFNTRDNLGSVRIMTNSAGAIQTSYTYDGWGNVISAQGSVASDFQYARLYFHGRSGLSLSRSRAYDAALGRWMSRDPVYEKGGINLYDYASNSPVTRIDPSGKLDAGTILIGGGGVELGTIIVGGEAGAALGPGGIAAGILIGIGIGVYLGSKGTNFNLDTLHDCASGNSDCCEDNGNACRTLCDLVYRPDKVRCENSACKKRCDNAEDDCNSTNGFFGRDPFVKSLKIK